MALEPFFQTGALRLYHGDAYAVMGALPERSVHCLVTSPPYWGLRRYSGHDGEQVRTFEDGWTGQYGSEPTPQMWAEHTAEWLRAARRVLRDDALAFVNLGDAYWGGKGQSSYGWSSQHLERPTLQKEYHHAMGGAGITRPSDGKSDVFKPLDLIWQSALLYPLLLRDGWYVRSVIVYSKPAPMPESVGGWEWRRCRVQAVPSARAKAGSAHAEPFGDKPQGARDGREFADHSSEYADCPGCPKCAATDGWVLRRGSWRPTSSHEYILMLAKTENYFADQEAVREAHTREWWKEAVNETDHVNLDRQDCGNRQGGGTPSGRNPRSFWRISAEPTKEKHYAAFPSELPERCIKVATSEHGVCAACGAPWARMIEKPFYGTWHDHDAVGEQFGKFQNGKGPARDYEKPKTVGWRATCRCNTEERVPATVLDPFFGTGSTGRAALRLGRCCIGIDIAQEYTDIAVKYLRQDLLV